MVFGEETESEKLALDAKERMEMIRNELEDVKESRDRIILDMDEIDSIMSELEKRKLTE